MVSVNLDKHTEKYISEKLRLLQIESIKVQLLVSFLHILKEKNTVRTLILQATYLIHFIVPLLDGKLDQFLLKYNFL